MLYARRTLARARRLRDEAEKVKAGDREWLNTLLEAALVLGRSVTLHLQAELNGKNGFAGWYETKRAEMKNELFEFFRETRNLVLKQRPAGIRKNVAVTPPPATLRLGASAASAVTRSGRRPPTILWQDTRYWIKSHAHRVQRRIWEPWVRWRRRREKHRRPAGTAVERFVFDGSPFPDRDAFEMLDDYFEKLAAIVAEAEARWDTNDGK